MLRWAALGMLAACSAEPTFGTDPRPGPPSLGTEPLYADYVEDAIVQVASPQVDILWVVDASCSMGPYQAHLTANFPSFMRFFLGTGLDYHVGVTSTDMDGVLLDGSLGRLRTLGGPAFITPDTPDPVGRFAQIASMGTEGSSSERGTSAVHAALTDRLYTDNAGFLRSQSALHTIVISDEANQVADGELHHDAWVRWYGALKPAELLTFSAITTALGADYVDATSEIGGIHWPIDTKDWDVVLERLGFRASGLQREVFLSRRPVEETLEVWLELDGIIGVTEELVTQQLQPVQPDPVTGDPVGHYRYNAARNAVYFVDTPPETTTLVRLRYVPLGGFDAP